MRLHRAVEEYEEIFSEFKQEIDVIREGILPFGRMKHGATKLANNEVLASCLEPIGFQKVLLIRRIVRIYVCTDIVASEPKLSWCILVCHDRKFVPSTQCQPTLSHSHSLYHSARRML